MHQKWNTYISETLKDIGSFGSAINVLNQLPMHQTRTLLPNFIKVWLINIWVRTLLSIWCPVYEKNIEELISRYDFGTSLATNDVLDDTLNAAVNIEETRASLRRAKIHKAAGTDGVPSEFYKYARDVLEQPQTALFNHSLDSGSYPSAWCEDLINPLHKLESPT